MHIITKLDIQKNNKKRVNVYIDEEYCFSCDAELVYRFGLKVSKSLDLEEMNKIVEDDNFMKAKNDALKFIERSYKTEKELREKLLKKGYEVKTIDKVMDFTKQYDFVNDKRYAEMYMKEKGQLSGINKIKYDLIRKGIDNDIIKELQSSMSEASESEGAIVLARKKYLMLSKRETDRKKINEKMLRFLVGKGYNWETAKNTLKKVADLDVEEGD